MAIGASGNAIVIFGRVETSNQSPNGGTDILVDFQLSEATIDGSHLDGVTHSNANIHADIEPTDSEIVAVLRDGLAERLSDEYAPSSFLGTDVRGCSI